MGADDSEAMEEEKFVSFFPSWLQRAVSTVHCWL